MLRSEWTIWGVRYLGVHAISCTTHLVSLIVSETMPAGEWFAWFDRPELVAGAAVMGLVCVGCMWIADVLEWERGFITLRDGRQN